MGVRSMFPVFLVGFLSLAPSAWADDSPGPIDTEDLMVPHISTVPATMGDSVSLFVRERVRSHGHHGGHGKECKHREAVLMVTGATTSAVPVFDLEFMKYSWAESLAKDGFDVFVMDLTGYGDSPRPFMTDPCNASIAMQLQFLIPNPLIATCAPSFSKLLTTPDSDRDEIDTVVNFIREERGVDRVHLIGWSRGGARVGSYAAIHPEKVDRMVLLAPNYGRTAPSGPPAGLPLAGAALDVQGSEAFFTLWDTDVECADQFTPEIRPAIQDSVLAWDQLGMTWGAAGTRRAPGLHGRGTNFWGWNAAAAAQVRADTLIFHGDLDFVVPEATQTNPLNEDLVNARHLYVKVACASHFLAWENRHTFLLDASGKWLRKGKWEGYTSGTVHIDAAGEIAPVP